MQKKVIVIGAGIGGLATAALLSKNGFKVTILEKNKSIGGRAISFKAKGFTFDLGPSWYLMPEVFENYFKQFDLKISNLYRLKKLNPSYQIFFSSTEKYLIYPNIQKIAKVFEHIEKGSSKNLKKYLDKSKKLHRLVTNNFLYTYFPNIFSLVKRNILIESIRINIFQSIENQVFKLFKSEQLRKILLYNLIFLGSDPKNTPMMYSLISHIELIQGVFYPIGGFKKVVKVLYKLNDNLKTKIYTNQEVLKIKYQENSFYIKTKTNNFIADIVVANADYPFIETKTLDKKYQTYSNKYWLNQKIAPSAFMLFLGLNQKVKSLKHHNLYLSPGFFNHFSQIFKEKKWPTDPSIYICCPTKTDHSLSPPGYENLFILVPIASGLKDTLAVRKKIYNKILNQLKNITGENIQKNIIYKKIFSINDFKSFFNSYKGTAFGLSHTLFQSANFRPTIKSKKIPNLYYIGQYTQPGIGVPMVLISSQLVSNKIINDHFK